MASLSSLLPFGSRFPTVTVDETLATGLYDRSRDVRLQTVRPYKGTEDGLERGKRLLTALHAPTLKTQLWGLRNRSNSLAFELHYSDDTELLQSRIATQTDKAFDLVGRQVDTYYDDSDTREVDPTFLDVHPGQHVAGTVLQLRQRNEVDRLRPIKNYRLDADHFDIGPFRSITKEMTGAAHHANCDVLVQFTIKPAVSNAGWSRLNWWYGVDETIDAITGQGDSSVMDWGEVSREIVEPFHQIGLSEERRRRRRRRLERQREEEEWAERFTPDHSDQASLPGESPVAKHLGEYRGMRGYHLCIRLLAVSDDAETARQRVTSVAEMFSFFDSRFEQGFEPMSLSNRTLRRMLNHAAGRVFTDRGMILPTDGLAGICRVPTDLELQEYDYSMSASGIGVPPRTPRKDWKAVGLDRSTASKAERQRALLAETDPDAPIYYGFGTKKGVEAGVEPERLNVHQFVGGSTGVGKTTLLINFFYQIMQRGHGGLFFDPKGQDALKIVKILPEHRTDDLVFIDIGTDAEYQVGFNFLEIPLDDPDPESQAFEDATDALADDLESLLAQSGMGGDWGTRMSTVTRAVVRGLAKYQVKTDTPVTMLDMAFLLANEEGRERLHMMMTEARIEWIKQATHVIAEYDQKDLEPLQRRIWEWTFSRTLRSIASHPHPTISIDDIVRDGKLVVVRNNANSDVAKRLIATALIRRIWLAIRRQTKRDSVPDPPSFFVADDEFDKIVSEYSNIHNILREARSFGLSMTLSAQNLDTGGGDDIGIPESIQKSIRGNCKTFLSFDPGEDDARGIARQHSTNIDAEDVKELSQHRMYMRTTNDTGDKTDSYKVGTFLPAEEVIEDVRSDEEAQALMHASQKENGQPKRSDAEIREDMFVGGGQAGTSSTGMETEKDLDDLDMTAEEDRNPALKAVVDTSIQEGAPMDYVAVSDTLDLTRRYVPGGGALTSGDDAWRKVYQHIPDSCLANYEEEGANGEGTEMYVKARDTGFMNIGESASDASAEHWAVMEDAYVPLTQLGFIVDILKQAGSMPDGVALVNDALQLDGVQDQATIADRVNRYRENYPELDRLAGLDNAWIEAEHSTGDTQPSQTVKNLAQAHNAGHHCLFLCREDVSHRVYNTVAVEPACCRSNHSVDGERRFYTGTREALTIDGEKMTRPGPANGENIWVYDEQTGQYILRDTDGTEHARFNTAAEIYEDASAYPDGGPRNIKPPVIPEYEFDGGDPTEAEWDIIEVPIAETDENDEKLRLTPLDLTLYQHDGEDIPLCDLPETDADRQTEKTTATVSTAQTENGRKSERPDHVTERRESIDEDEDENEDDVVEDDADAVAEAYSTVFE